jgi:hypothetical protein
VTLQKNVNGVLVDLSPEEEAEFLAMQGSFPIPSPFKPIEPVPFWRAAWDLLSLKKTDVYSAITDPDERYLAELDVEGRKSYLRDDPMVVQLATLNGYTPEAMDNLWLFVQENYR